MSNYIDISVPVSPNIPQWPGSPEVSFNRNLDLDQGDIANDTTISLSVHTGTHVDAPLHFLKHGKGVEGLSLDILMGKVYVAHLPNVNIITSDALADCRIPPNTQRLLLHTRNSQLWENQVAKFQKDFVALTADAAQWVVDHGIKLIGIDYLSIQLFGDSPKTHEILLDSEVIIIEGLNLTNVYSGEYELICLPIKLAGVEGAPARVILKTIN